MQNGPHQRTVFFFILVFYATNWKSFIFMCKLRNSIANMVFHFYITSIISTRICRTPKICTRAKFFSKTTRITNRKSCKPIGINATTIITPTIRRLKRKTSFAIASNIYINK